MICWPEIHMFPDKARKPFEPAAFSVFSCAESFEVTRLEEIEISILLQRNQDYCDLQPLYDKEKEALFQYTIIVTISITQIIKILNIFASIAEEYSGKESKLSKFVTSD